MAEENTQPVEGEEVQEEAQEQTQADGQEQTQEQKVIDKSKYVNLSKKYTEAQKELEAYKQKEAEEQGKFKELAESWQTKYQKLENKWRQTALDKALQTEAQKLNPNNLDAVLKLADTSAVEIDEDGNVQGADEALRSVYETVPELFQKQAPQNVGRDTGSPENGAGKRVYSQSEIDENPEFRNSNWDDILAAYKEGRIKND